MIEEPIVGTLLGFVLFCGLVYLVYEAMRVDPKAFMAWYRWRMQRPLPEDYKTPDDFRVDYHHWRYKERPIRPVFRKRP